MIMIIISENQCSKIIQISVNQSNERRVANVWMKRNTSSLASCSPLANKASPFTSRPTSSAISSSFMARANFSQKATNWKCIKINEKLYVITYTFYSASILTSEGLELWEVENRHLNIKHNSTGLVFDRVANRFLSSEIAEPRKYAGHPQGR